MFPGLIAAAAVLCAGADPAPAPPITATARQDALARYGAGVWLARRDRLLSAAKSFEAAARLDPDAAAPLRELVPIYAQLGRETQAIRLARRVLEKDPEDADTAHTLARLLYDLGEPKDAVAAARLAAASPTLADRPDKALAVYRDLAKLADATGDFAGAADALNQAIDLLKAHRRAVLGAGGFTRQEADAALADSYERLGKVRVKQEKFEPAAEAFLAAHRLYADPEKANDAGAAARLDWNLSGVYAEKGDPAAALLHLERFLRRQPRAAEPYDRLAALLRRAGHGDEVIGQLRGYAEQDPKNESLLAVMAAELARDPITRRQADDIFARLDRTSNNPQVIRVAFRSHVETGRAGLVVADLDRAYEAAHPATPTMPADPAEDEKRAFATGKARAFADTLRAEPVWAVAVLRAAAEDLATGTRRNSRTWHFLAALAARHGKLDLAAGQFRQAARTAPRESEAAAYTGLLDVLWRQRKPAEIATVCRDALRSSRLDPMFFNYHLAQALANLGKADEAIVTANRAIAQAGETGRLDAQVGKLRVLHTLGRHADAIAQGRKLLDTVTTPADRNRVRYVLAGAYYSAKKYAEWEAELRAILDADPDHAGACNDLGYHLADQGRNLDEAERLVRHAIATDRADRRKAGDAEPVSAAYVDSLGWVLFRRGKLAEARETLERAVSIPEGATHGEIWDHLGDVCFRLGDKLKARAAWEQALTRYTTEPRALQAGRPDEVKRKIKRVP